ncbi:uncharacterized protein B0H18DRAFT_153032 [Fomitopsis serialis]|uniref:uncharacterized protein n=1 Tax=Fomitopsis serialis TaxID=139415 RepID=UPI0020081E48|nr:uncharacterized protein B0H18DRAFT_153032 [Neoantrodia serialis]KAH9913914.1 hypothetical protein B0H18DRAFT_153032 [Neoantrodia serialis]
MPCHRPLGIYYTAGERRRLGARDDVAAGPHRPLDLLLICSVQSAPPPNSSTPDLHRRRSPVPPPRPFLNRQVGCYSTSIRYAWVGAYIRFRVRALYCDAHGAAHLRAEHVAHCAIQASRLSHRPPRSTAPAQRSSAVAGHELQGDGEITRYSAVPDSRMESMLMRDREGVVARGCRGPMYRIRGGRRPLELASEVRLLRYSHGWSYGCATTHDPSTTHRPLQICRTCLWEPSYVAATFRAYADGFL